MVSQTRSQPLLAALFVILLVLQVKTNILLESEGGQISLADRLPFYFAIVLGVIMAASGHFKMLRWNVLAPAIAFLSYMLVLVALTSEDPLIAYIVPNYGIVSWMVLGVASAIALNAISQSFPRKNKNGILRLVVWVPAVMLGVLVFDLREYAVSPWRVDSYQFPAVNLIVLLIFCLLALDRWEAEVFGGKGGGFVSLAVFVFVLFGTFLSYLVSTLNSTAIVAVWGLLFLLIFWRFAFRSNVVSLVIFSVAILALVYFASDSEIADIFFGQTRFGQLLDGSLLEFSSLTTRVELLPLFGSQFSVSPVFGHMRAEVAAGYEQGNFIHSLPLSALTHTGMIGASALFVVSVNVYREKLKGEIAFFSKLVFTIIALCATIFAFFSWIPLWYLIGFLSVKTDLKIK